MNNQDITLPYTLMFIVCFMLSLLSVKTAFADEGKHEHERAGHHDKEVAHIDEDMAFLNSLSTAIASGGDISKTLTLYGIVTLSPEHTSHVTARFAGRITRVYVEYGDKVKKGQVLASVESNSSLQTYNITAPLSGNVIAKHANAGEVVSEQTLFTITNTSTLWAELKVFPSQASRIKSKQTVVLQSDDMQTRSIISQLLPNTAGEPFRIARVKFKNPDDDWFPGLLVGAEVFTDKRNVDVRVPLSALQQYENKTVVFIKEGDTYKPQPVSLGIQDEEYAEVLSGLNAGQQIVTENSYLIKADLEKDGAEHSH